MFQRSENDPPLYIEKKDNDILSICIYVNEIILLGSPQYLIDEFKLSIMSNFDSINLGVLVYFLNIQSLSR